MGERDKACDVESALPKTTTVLLNSLRRDGDERAWEEFVGRYRPVLVGFGVKLGLSEEDAADAAQQTLAEFVREFRADRYERGRGRLSSWILGIARHRIESARRDRGRMSGARGESMLVDLRDEATVTSLWREQWRQAILERAMDRLRRETKVSESNIRAFELVAMRGVSADAAARECGIGVDEVYLARHRVTKKLRELVDEITRAYEEDG